MDRSVLIACELDQFKAGISSEGLTCRFNARTSVSAFWDAERQAVCCRVQREVSIYLLQQTVLSLMSDHWLVDWQSVSLECRCQC
jgi:hypothetical protein